MEIKGFLIDTIRNVSYYEGVIVPYCIKTSNEWEGFV
jgi:hypothetical protein